MKKIVSVTRKTSESQIDVVLNFNGVNKNYRDTIKTPIVFLNHMIEQLSWRSGINIAVELKLDKFFLSHVVCEDAAITVGKAVANYIEENAEDGVVGFGDGIGIIDEAKATTAISFEGRTGLFFHSDVSVPTETEGMLSEDVLTFLEGFVQGANCTLHIDVEKGENGHHIWEAVFRSFGVALSRATALDEKRKGMTSGVAGKISFDIK